MVEGVQTKVGAEDASSMQMTTVQCETAVNVSDHDLEGSTACSSQDPLRALKRATEINSAASTDQIGDAMRSASYVLRLGKNILFGLIFVSIFFIALICTMLYSHELSAYTKSLMKDPIRLIYTFFIAYLIGTLVTFPTITLCIFLTFAFVLLCGFVKGIFYAITLNLVAFQLSHLVAFLTGRYLFGQPIYDQCIQYRSFFVLNRAVVMYGTYVTSILRCAFVVPHPILTYALAVTDIPLVEFMNGNWIIFPVSFFYAYLGASAAALQQSINERRQRANQGAETSTLNNSSAVDNPPDSAQQSEGTSNSDLLLMFGGLVILIYFIRYVIRVMKAELARFDAEYELEQEERFKKEAMENQSEC